MLLPTISTLTLLHKPLTSTQYKTHTYTTLYITKYTKSHSTIKKIINNIFVIINNVFVIMPWQLIAVTGRSKDLTVLRVSCILSPKNIKINF